MSCPNIDPASLMYDDGTCECEYGTESNTKPRFKAVVAYMNLMDNDLRQIVVTCSKKDYREALIEASKEGLMGDYGKTDQHIEWIQNLPEDEEDGKQTFFDTDMMFSVLWLED